MIALALMTHTLHPDKQTTGSSKEEKVTTIGICILQHSHERTAWKGGVIAEKWACWALSMSMEKV
jgi:hypothetical protein